MRYFGLNHRPSSGVKLKLKELCSYLHWKVKLIAIRINASNEMNFEDKVANKVNEGPSLSRKPKQNQKQTQNYVIVEILLDGMNLYYHDMLLMFTYQ